jgi:hypothetical protein
MRCSRAQLQHPAATNVTPEEFMTQGAYLTTIVSALTILGASVLVFSVFYVSLMRKQREILRQLRSLAETMRKTATLLEHIDAARKRSDDN